MKNYNNTTYALLGILTTGCRSGYDIKQFIDNSLNHFWKISYGQIYPTLKRLEQDGLATVKTSTQEGKPERKEYDLTPKGRKVLEHWLEEPIKQVPVERNEVLLKLFFGQYQENEASINLIKHYKEKLATRYDIYVAIERSISKDQTENKDAKYWLFTLDYGIRVTKAAIEWCEETIENLERSN